MLLTKEIKILEVCSPIAAANNTDQNTDRIDMSNWDGVIFITPITDSVSGGVAKIQVEQNTSNSDTGMAALTDAYATATSAQNDDLNNLLLVVDVFRPTERYVQAAITSTTQNIAFGNTIAILYNGRKYPITDDATVKDIGQVISPSEA